MKTKSIMNKAAGVALVATVAVSSFGSTAAFAADATSDAKASKISALDKLAKAKEKYDKSLALVNEIFQNLEKAVKDTDSQKANVENLKKKLDEALKAHEAAKELYKDYINAPAVIDLKKVIADVEAEKSTNDAEVLALRGQIAALEELISERSAARTLQEIAVNDTRVLLDIANIGAGGYDLTKLAELVQEAEDALAQAESLFQEKINELALLDLEKKRIEGELASAVANLPQDQDAIVNEASAASLNLQALTGEVADAPAEISSIQSQITSLSLVVDDANSNILLQESVRAGLQTNFDLAQSNYQDSLQTYNFEFGEAERLTNAHNAAIAAYDKAVADHDFAKANLDMLFGGQTDIDPAVLAAATAAVAAAANLIEPARTAVNDASTAEIQHSTVLQNAGAWLEDTSSFVSEAANVLEQQDNLLTGLREERDATLSQVSALQSAINDLSAFLGNSNTLIREANERSLLANDTLDDLNTQLANIGNLNRSLDSTVRLRALATEQLRLIQESINAATRTVESAKDNLATGEQAYRNLELAAADNTAAVDALTALQEAVVELEGELEELKKLLAELLARGEEIEFNLSEANLVLEALIESIQDELKELNEAFETAQNSLNAGVAALAQAEAGLVTTQQKHDEAVKASVLAKAELDAAIKTQDSLPKENVVKPVVVLEEGVATPTSHNSGNLSPANTGVNTGDLKSTDKDMSVIMLSVSALLLLAGGATVAATQRRSRKAV